MVAPVYDDAAAAGELVRQLENAFSSSEINLRIMFVDDGSPQPLADQLQIARGSHVDVLRLRRNVGHQRAIALGTAYVHEHIVCDAMLVMDADGEDRPEDAIRLVDRCRELGGEKIVFAERTRRSESALFQVCYRVYQLVHWMLTGIRVRVGNFSVVPSSRLAALVTMPSLWNHYASAIFQARLPRACLPTVRGKRYSGNSKMNFVALVIHGLQAISVFIEVVAVRLFITICLMTSGSALMLGLTLVTRWFSRAAVPSWAPYVLGGSFAATAAAALGSFSLTLGFLAQRNSLDFIPLRDYHLFVEGLREVGCRAQPMVAVYQSGDEGEEPHAVNE